MDLDDFRLVLDTAGVDVWSFIDAAITVASTDWGTELKHRRDGIVERLYALTSPATCRNCDAPDLAAARGGEVKRRSVEKEGSPEEHPKTRSPSPQQSPQQSPEEDEMDPYGGLFDDEQRKVLEIKEQLEEPGQSEDVIVDLLQSLADMDITFGALKETDIGRHVNRLRKHSSSDVRRLVKHLVKKWKEIVDEWVKLNQPGESSALMADGDSPQQKIPQNGHHQVPDFAYSPNPNNGSSGSDRNYSEPEPKPKPVPRKEAPPRPAAQSIPASNSALHNRPRDNNIDLEKQLASARKRLHENYKEVANVKKQRTIQVMDIHEIPKPKNTFFGKNKGSGSRGKHW